MLAQALAHRLCLMMRMRMSWYDGDGAEDGDLQAGCGNWIQILLFQ